MSIVDSDKKINPVVNFGDAQGAGQDPSPKSTTGSTPVANFSGNLRKIGYGTRPFLSNLITRLKPQASADKYYTVALILLVGFGSFGLGRLSVVSEGRESVIIDEGYLVQEPKNQAASVVESVPAALPVGGKLVASKNGTKYYFPWCGGASKIAETNKVWFNSESEAKAKGYSPAANCKGLK